MFSQPKYDESPRLFSKLETKYWTTKQKVLEKFGHEQDSFVVSCDSELDARLIWFEHNESALANLIKTLKEFIKKFDVLAVNQDKIVVFFKHYSRLEMNKVGKMMTSISNLIIANSLEKDVVKNPFVRMLNDLDTFYNHAISDCKLSIHNMEAARTQYRATMLWMADSSKELDPDAYKKMSKYRNAQINVKKSRDNFEKLKNDIIEKICILSTSRTTMLIQSSVEQHQKFHEMHAHLADHYEKILSYYSSPISYKFETLKNILGPNNGVYGSEDEELLSGDNTSNIINPTKNNNNNKIEDKSIDSTNLSKQDISSENSNLIDFTLSESIDSSKPSNKNVNNLNNERHSINEDDLLYEGMLHDFSIENNNEKNELYGIDWNSYMVNSNDKLNEINSTTTIYANNDTIDLKNEQNNLIEPTTQQNDSKNHLQSSYESIGGHFGSSEWKNFFSDINPSKSNNSSDQC